jgi:multiple sugar transport system substrate-binding protein
VWQFGSTGAKRADDNIPWDNWFKRKIDEFSAQNPGITINYAMKGQEAGGTTLFIDSAVAAGQPPDIYLDVVFREAVYGSQGLMEPLDDALTADQWKSLDPSQVQTTTGKDGKHWGIPLWAPPPFPLGINKTLADAAGATNLIPKDPDRDWTTDDYVAFLKAVSKPPQRYGSFFFAKTPSFDYTINGYAGSFGAQFYANGDYCHTVINSPQGVQWMEWMASVIKQNLVVPGAAGLTDDDEDAAWTNQQIVLSGGGPYYTGLSKQLVASGQVKKLDVWWVNYPHVAGGKTAPLPPNAGWAATLFKQTDPDKRAAAIKFLQFFTAEANSIDFAKGYTWISSYTDAAKDWAGDDPDRQFILRMVQKNGVADLGYNINNFNQVRLLWAQARQAIFSGDKTPKQALDDYVAAANPLLCK